MDGGEAWRPLNPDWGRTLDSRRIELFKLAAPVFEDLWDRPWTFALVVGLLSLEWVLRRRWGLR